ncbi:MAG TPA: non-ribosomal peptide synthetase, partial [Acidobacteria bacterium]|nr:non-ribosomal peptide synthetase [Acidobacteriota bacterium]
LTYAELHRRANRLAHRLRRLGVGPEARVGVLLERSPDLVVSLLGILKAGGAYVPLDPGFPAERLAWTAGDAGLCVLLTEAGLTAAVPAVPALPVLVLEEEKEALAAESAAEPPLRAAADNAAYVLYTSGSTGRPKAVVVCHGALVNLLAAIREEPGMTAADTVLAVTTISFDMAVVDLLLPLAVGARVVLARREEAGDGAALARLIESRDVDVVQVTPVTWQMLLAGGGRAPSKVRGWSGGEALAPDLAAGLTAVTRSFWNLYGPTETTVYATAGPVEAGPGPVSIGRPLSRTRVVLLDPAGRLTPLGSAGHLHVGGAGLARGYLHRPDLTAAQFVPDPTGVEPGARLYRTGDLARFLADGRIDYLGRIDHQVKLRGYRIELGEIESVLRRHTGVREAVVVLLEGKGGAEDRRLAAAWTAGDGPAPAAGPLRSFLAEKLPPYMVPSQLVELRALPLTPSGKVDRRAVAAVLAAAASAPEEGQEPALPRGPVEEMLVGVWEEILERRVGVEDDFFALGGHSLLATQVVSRVRSVFAVELPLRALFEHPTVAGLAGEIEKATPAGGAAPPPIEPVPRDATGSPLSFAQQRLWLLDQLGSGALYHVPVALRLHGELSVAVLTRVFAEIVRRHEALRTVFRSDGAAARQVILPPAGFAMPLLDLSALSPALRKAVGAAVVREEARRPFDLAQGPLVRIALVRLEETEHELLLVLHHIVSDGWSMGVLVREVTALYAAFAAGRPSPLPELAVQSADYAAWQRGWLSGDVLEREVRYWRD